MECNFFLFVVIIEEITSMRFNWELICLTTGKIVLTGTSSSKKRWLHLRRSCWSPGYTHHMGDWQQSVRSRGIPEDQIDQFFLFKVYPINTEDAK